MNLYFLAANGDKRLVRENAEEKTALKDIEHYVNNINPTFKIYYTRMWYSEDHGGMMYDVGSHTEFFLLAEDN